MKIKQRLHITNPDRFLRGEYDWCFDLFPKESKNQKYICCGDIEFEVDIDSGKVIEIVTNAINEEIESTREEFTARMNILETRKQELLALTHETES